MIGQETIQRIMDAARIEEVISEFVSLKKRGANYIGCCPFHNEKTPSFNVSPVRNIFKCFGCGESGDVVKFLMKHERYTYPEALRWLARRYGIEIEEVQLSDEQKERQSERDALFHLSDFAQKYFASLLFDNEIGRNVGLAYFHNRGLSDMVIKDFGLGFCLEEWDNFTRHARANGYSDSILEKTGLTIFKNEDGKQRQFDRFRGRVIFPIYSVSGRVLGFSGRILGKEKHAAKYVNSPDSEIYNKSHILYGLYQAKNAITRQDKCYLVEGNIDVISMYQSGVENTVASCGTSLTVEQVRLMRRYTKNITVLYDGDSAGIKAAFRAVNMLFEEGLHVRVVLFPDGEDPDSYAQKYGSQQLQDYLRDNESNFILFKTKVLSRDIANDPIRKAEVLNDIVHTISLVPDLMERAEYVKQCASMLHVSESTLQNELAKVLNRRLYVDANHHTPDPRDKDLSVAESNEPTDSTSPVALQSAAPVVPYTINPALSQERKIVSLLLNSGNRHLSYNDIDEKGEPIEVAYSVAQIVVGEILGDQLSFDDPVCQKIFNLYAEHISMGESTLDESIFVSSDDRDIREFAIGQMMTDYHVSDNWATLKHIYVPTPDSRLRADVEESILNFKLKKLDIKINDIDRQFPYLNSDEERLTLIAQKMALVKLKQNLGATLNRVIT